MAHDGIFATSDEIKVKAGGNVVAAGASETRINSLCLQIEGFLCCLGKYDFSTNWASLNAVYKTILSEAQSAWVGMMLIIYDMADYTSKVESQDMLNILRDDWLRCVSLIRDQEIVKKIITP